MIVINSAPVLGPGGIVLINSNNPRVGWHNVAVAGTLGADEQTVDEPLQNLTNDATYLMWRALTTAAQSVGVTLGAAEDVDYFAVAKHNFGSSAATIEFQYSTNGTDWTTAVTPFMPNTDEVIIHEFDPVFASFFRLLITPGLVPPAMAIFYVGKILALQRRIYVGHTPFPYGRRSTVSTGRSESGHFLGRMLRRQSFETGVDMHNIKPDWYRQEMERFFEAAVTRPFFWAWRPGDYPLETGLAWLQDDPVPSNERPNGMMQISFSMQGLR